MPRWPVAASAALLARCAAPTVAETAVETAVYSVLSVGRCNGGDEEALWIDPMNDAELEAYNKNHGTAYDKGEFEAAELSAESCWRTCSSRVPGVVAADYQAEIVDCNCYTECDCLGFDYVSDDDEEGYLILPRDAALPGPCGAGAEERESTREPTRRPTTSAVNTVYAATSSRAPGTPRRPQRWSRGRRPPTYQSPAANSYADALGFLGVLGVLSLLCGCGRAAARRCAAGCASCLAAALERASASRTAVAGAGLGERVSLVVPEPDRGVSSRMEIEAL